MRTSLVVCMFLAAACGGKSASTTTPATGGDAAATIEPLTRSFAATDDEPEATVRMPRVTIPGNPTASAAINQTLGVPASADGLSSGGEAGLDFTVGYNADGLLAIMMVHETLGAYSDSYVEHFLFDTRTGARLTGAELFRADGLTALASAVDGKLQAQLDAARTERTDCTEGGDDPYQGQYTADHLRDVYLTADGQVYFPYDFDFPHAMQACEPDGDLRMPVAELTSYLRDDSPLRRAVK